MITKELGISFCISSIPSVFFSTIIGQPIGFLIFFLAVKLVVAHSTEWKQEVEIKLISSAFIYLAKSNQNYWMYDPRIIHVESREKEKKEDADYVDKKNSSGIQNSVRTFLSYMLQGFIFKILLT